LSHSILGLNAYHGDASACLLIDGRIVAAAEEERFRRVKHWAGFPSEAIAWCLREGGLTLASLDHVALNSDPTANISDKALYALTHAPLQLIKDRLSNQKKRLEVRDELDALGLGTFGGEVHRIEHHHAHLASAFYCSPFERAVAVSVDGFGDFASGAWGLGDGARLSVDGRVTFPHSLGAFYQAITQFLGFPHYGDEYKVMGLAPYGKPTFLPQMREIVKLKTDGSYALELGYFRHHKEKIPYQWTGGSPSVGALWAPKLEELLGPARDPAAPLEQRHKDLAHSAQAMYEEAFFHLLDALHARYACNAITVAGGCGMNSVANGKIRRRSKFQRVYIQSAAGDAGGAIGAAAVVNARLALPKPRMPHAYLGPKFSNAEIAALIDARANDLRDANCTVETLSELDTLCARTASAIADGQVIGWFQGELEWGPRALGNRSIVCDPRRADMKDILNLKIKRRESFRPFAPSILREAVSEWFEEDDEVPFMMQVFQIREAQRARIPAVTHVDGSGRLQTVERAHNLRYYRLIEKFRELTQVPIVLNTSFNENEPVVCRPVEALDCFLRTKMDVLVLGDVFIQRRAA
jgi:carbamoyltransferase